MEVTANLGQQPYPMETGKKNLKNRCGYHEDGDIGGYPIPQYRKKKWQIPKYCMENCQNTDTTYFNHIYNWFHILMAASI